MLLHFTAAFTPFCANLSASSETNSKNCDPGSLRKRAVALPGSELLRVDLTLCSCRVAPTRDGLLVDQLIGARHDVRIEDDLERSKILLEVPNRRRTGNSVYVIAWFDRILKN